MPPIFDLSRSESQLECAGPEHKGVLLLRSNGLSHDDSVDAGVLLVGDDVRTLVGPPLVNNDSKVMKNSCPHFLSH